MSNEKFGISDQLITAFINARVMGHVDARSDLSAIGAKRRATGSACTVLGTHETWIWDAASTDPASTGLVIVPDDTAALATYVADQASEAGRWILANSQSTGGLAAAWKQPVRAASTANLVATRTGNVLLADANGALGTMDGVTLVVGNRVLLKDQSTGANNGIWVITSLGAAGAKFRFIRATDADTTAKLTTGTQVPVNEGSIYANHVFYLGTTSITLNTTALVFTDDRPLTSVAPASSAYAAVVGVSTQVARADHVHALPSQANTFHTVRGVVIANVADLAAFTVAGNDGLTYAEGQRVLLAKQTTTTQDGIYVVGAVGGGTAPLTRATDWAAAAVLAAGQEIAINEGTLWGNTKWFATLAGAITVAASSPAFYPRKYVRVTGVMAGTPGIMALSAEWILSATKSSVVPVAKAPGTQGNLSIGALTAGAGDGAVTITSTANETSTLQVVIEN